MLITAFLWEMFTLVNACKTREKQSWNECNLHAFWDTLWRQVWLKRAINGVFVSNFHLCKTREKTVLKLMHFACVLKHFLETNLKNRVQNVAFLWGVFTLVNACKTLAKKVLKWMNFACVLRHIVETSREKNVLTTSFLWSIFILVNACKTRAKAVLKLMHFAFILRHFMETSLKERAKNYVFVSYFLFGQCLLNTCKNRFVTNAFCMRL